MTEEVERQGHDTERLDGIERVGWMLDAWSYALANQHRPPVVADVIEVGKRVERQKNKRGYRKCRIFVGGREGAPFDQVPTLIEALFARRETLTTFDFYRGLLEIHPFVDGNGRMGKVFLNWANGSLYEPIFPPNNFWGREIRNP